MFAVSGTGQVTITWPLVSTATSYNIYRSTTAAGEGTTVFATSTTASYLNTGLTNGTNYSFAVVASNSAGQAESTFVTPGKTALYGVTTGKAEVEEVKPVAAAAAAAPAADAKAGGKTDAKADAKAGDKKDDKKK